MRKSFRKVPTKAPGDFLIPLEALSPLPLQSRDVLKQLPLRYDYLGEHEMKNIAEPVRVYRAQVEPEAASSKLRREKKLAGKGLSKAALGIIAVVVIAGAAVLYQFALRSSPSKTEVASEERMALPLPDVPSIAVLPFVNMSGDPKQEFLCDGMTDEIITALSKVPRLFVIAQNSSFTYKGKPTKVKQVSEELGVRYVLEGSVQRSADRIRINAQLIDALTGNHLWAERYERDLKDLFALEDEITIKILAALQVKLTALELGGAPEKYYKGKQGLDCFLKLTEATGYYRRGTIEDNKLARQMMEEAIAMCPENPMGYIRLGWVYHQDYLMGKTKSPRETIEKGIELAQKALSIDDSMAGAHALLCALYDTEKEFDKAIAEGERAVALNPGDLTALKNYGQALRYAGRPEEAIPVFPKAIRLNPFAFAYLYSNLGSTFRNAGRFEEAVSALKQAIQLAPDDITAHLPLAVTYSLMGREKEARAEAAEVLRINPIMQ